MLAVLKGTVEWQQYQQYGLLNAGTIGAIGVVVTTVMEMWGLWKQGMTVWTRRSGESVSIATFNYTTWLFLACGIYSIYIHSAAAVFSGFASSVVQLPIIFGLLRFKKFRRWEMAFMCMCPFMPVAMFFMPSWRDFLFLAFAVGNVFAMGGEPLELFKTKKTGAVDIRLYSVWTITTLVWMVFVIPLGNIPMIISQILITIIIIGTVVLWCVYRMREPDPPRVLSTVFNFVRRVPR